MIIEKVLENFSHHRDTFYIEQDLKSMLFTFEIDKGYAYIFINDSNGLTRVQYLNGKAPNKVLLSQNIASIGTYPGKISQGLWEIIIITFNPSENHTYKNVFCKISIDKNINVLPDDLMIFNEPWVKYNGGTFHSTFDFDKIYENKKRWYCGDFHSHTRLSDGHMDLIEARKVIDNIQKLDFLFITDHNMIHTGFNRGKGLVIPGIEITSHKGHFNILGNKDDQVIPNKKELNLNYIEELMDIAKNQNAICSINHSMMSPWHWQFESLTLKKIDVIEICCDPTFYSSQASTSKTLELMSILWNDGHKIYGIGGSDSHLLPEETYEYSAKPSIYGDPKTYVLLDFLSANEIIKGVKEGRSIVTREIEIYPEINGSKTYVPGEEIFEKNIQYNLKIEKVREELLVNLVINGKIIEKKHIKIDSYISFSIELSESYSWIRIDITKLNGDFEAYINPVYFGKKESKLKTWKDVLDVMEETIEH